MPLVFSTLILISDSMAPTRSRTRLHAGFDIFDQNVGQHFSAIAGFYLRI